MTQRLCKVCDGWHDLDNWPHNCIRPITWTRSDLPTPQVIIDTMDGVKSMLDGKMYDSKSNLRRTYKHAGVVEMGNEKLKPFKKPKIDQKAVSDTVDKAFARAGFGA